MAIHTTTTSPEHPANTNCRQPCQNGCGFFGSPGTKNLCSVCFTKDNDGDFHLLEEKNMLPRIKTKTSSNNVCFSDDSCNDQKKQVVHCEYFCDKKVIGLVEFMMRCRCGGRFCEAHRFPENHACKYDYAAARRQDLLKENPVCKADKLNTRV